MKWLTVLLLVFTTDVSASEIWLKVGQVMRLPASPGQPVRVGARGVIKVIDGNSSVQIVGLKIGQSTLFIGPRSYVIKVSLSEQKEFIVALRAELKAMLGLRLDESTNPVSIAGTLLRFSDWLKIAELARQTRGNYVFKAQALPDVAEMALKHLEGRAREKGFPVVRFRADPEFTAQVPRSAQNLKANATDVFKPYGIQVQSTDSQLMVRPLIRTRVILAELSRNDERELGIQWPSEYSAQLLPNVILPSSLMAKLRALETAGHAQILASPNLLCRSGSEAKFHAGGEFPIKIQSRLTRDVVWKKHGVLLSVKPTADFQGAISLEIDTEISTLDLTHAVEGIPALKENSVKSHFDLPGKRTIALSGLLRQETGGSKEGLPFLTGIPVLGALFSSQKFQKHQTELVIFVTPEIYVPNSDEKIEMPAGWVHSND